MLDIASKAGLQQLRIGTEATSNLGWNLAHYLKAELQKYEPTIASQIYVINVRKVARFKKGYETLPKNDRMDAWVIAAISDLVIGCYSRVRACCVETSDRYPSFVI